jgi:vacuole morphology and inheritance protein 14
MPEHATKLFPVLLGILNDNSDEVVLQTIEVLAQIVRSSNSSVDEFDKAKYTEFLVSLLKLFNEDKQFLDSRGTLIIRQLCVLLNAEYIYCTFAEILSNEEIVNIKFASAMVRTLNNILLTTSELFDLRNLLRNITDPKSAKLFQCLYKCWAHCPVSTLSICLLAQCYQHVSDLVIIL